MTRDRIKNQAGDRGKTPAGEAREARLKAALRANLKRRKSQGKSRRGLTQETDTPDKGQGRKTDGFDTDHRRS